MSDIHAQNDFDLDFRPADYWDAPDPVAAILQNVKGQERRRMIRAFVTGGAPTLLGPIDPGLVGAAVDDDTRADLGRIHPAWMGGEYLPDYARGEVEIARIVLASTLQDVLSVRARRRPNGVHVYRMVDEYESTWDIRPRTSRRPLTLRRLIALIDGAECLDMGADGEDLIAALQEGAGGLPDARGFVTVESDVYPRLGAWYAAREAAEMAKLEAEEELEEEE